MSNHVHICQWCEGRYPGTTLLVEIDDRGNCACECPVKDECPECSPDLYKPVCVTCDEDGVITLATEQRDGEDLCANHAQSRDEKAYERILSDFYGGSGPQSDRERFDVDSMRVRR